MTLKRHLTYQDQIARLKQRNLTYENHDKVLEVLRTVGYYRFSAYTYPFRLPVVDEKGKVVARLDDFQVGATFEDALKLYEFDQRLRLLLQDALEVIEVAFCAHVGYVLGKRSPDAHLNIEDLETEFCHSENQWGKPRHIDWVRRYDKLKKHARTEDYVQHHHSTYGDSIPIWAATEFLDFGSIVSLFEMMKKADRLEIAQSFGLKNDQFGILHSWMLSLNDLRNRCAHNNRVWNRVSRLPRKPSPQMTSAEFRHFMDLSESQQSNLYGISAVVAYLVRKIDPLSPWPRRAKHEFEGFGNVFGMTLETTMGFPDGWQNEALWR